jgi:hypothetical protein
LAVNDKSFNPINPKNPNSDNKIQTMMRCCMGSGRIAIRPYIIWGNLGKRGMYKRQANSTLGELRFAPTGFRKNIYLDP